MSLSKSIKGQALLPVLAVLLWLLSYAFTTRVTEDCLEQHAQNLQEQVLELQNSLEKDAEAVLVEARNESSSHWNALDELLNRDGRYFLVSEAWSAQAACLDAELPETMGTSALQLEDGAYLHTFRKDHWHKVHGLQKILQTPPYENRYLKRGAHADIVLPEGVELRKYTDGLGLNAPDGSLICGVHWADTAKQRVVSNWAWLLRAIALFLILPILWRAGKSVAEAFGTLLGIALVLLSSMVLGYTVPNIFEESGELFDPSLYATSTVLGSLGHLLIIAMCALFLASFVRDLLRSKPNKPSIGASVLSLALLLVLARMVAKIMIGSVNDSTIDLNLFQIQHFGLYSFIAILSSALLLGSWVILAYALVNQWWPNKLDKRTGLMLVVLGVVTVLTHHLIGVRDTIFMFWPFVILLIFYYKGVDHLRSVKLIVIVAIIAMFNAHVLNKYAAHREARDRVVMAERLAADQDPILERLFGAIGEEIRNDKEIIRLLVEDTPCPIQEVENRLRQEHFSEGFWERYAITANVFDAVNSFRCDIAAGNTASWEELYDLYGNGYTVPGVLDLRTTDSSDVDVLYVSMIPIARMDEPGISGYVFLRFQPRSAPEELGFPELLLAGEDPIDSRIRRYAYSEYRQGLQVSQFGDKAYPVKWEMELENGPNWLTSNNYRDLAYLNGHVLVLMGTKLPSVLDQATTFSYLFMFFVIIAVLLFAIWWWLIERGLFALTLRSKVRTTLLLFVLIGSMFFGFGARKLLVDSFAQRVDSDLREKTHSVLVELQHKVGARDAFTQEMKPELDYLLRKFSKVFFSDITLYDLDGKLLATSRPQLFDAGLLGRRMAPDAFQALALQGTSEFIHNERIGELTYRSAYVPFLNDQGQVLAFLDLPYFARQNELDTGLSGLLVAIVNLFVLLFALSMLAAVFISNWTTRPLAILEKSLSKIDLASTNSPLKYSGRDEVGRLVEVYNNKVNELKESAERLARSERESAWREMAKQVAHEIKNPLTPMKLSIQHFERTWDPNAPNAKERMQRFSEGMVGQIDTLSRIAEEFAHFAKMPRSTPRSMDLAGAVRSAIELFKDTSNMEVSFSCADGVESMVMADYEHLVRVFNNLIKNAMEAIPDERDGVIKVHLCNADSSVLVSIEDNGNGIPDDIQERIFVPNFTTRSTGMGLGLAMVKRMVESAGGKVWFESTTGEGTTFYVSIPKQAEEENVI